MGFELEKSRQEIELRMDDGALIRVRRHGNLNGPRLVFSHGNGLAIDGYAPFWTLFCERYDVIVFDLRNHGQNPCHGATGHTWPVLVRDAEAIWHGIRTSWGDKPAAGVFHSLSGIVALGQASEIGARWRLLILFDPPLTPPASHPLRALFIERQRELARRTLRRRERFSSPLELAHRFEQNPLFSRWVPRASGAMACATLRPDPASGSYVLSCPRELEARIYAISEDLALWQSVERVKNGLKLVCGDPADEEHNVVSMVGCALAREYGLEFEAIPKTSHFLQLEQPARCAQAVEEFLRQHGFAR